MRWCEAVKGFLQYLEGQRGYSVNTADAYRRDLEQFAQILEFDENAEVVRVFTKANIRRYVYFLKDISQKTKSIARKRACLQSFGKYMMKTQTLSFNPVRLISSIKLEKTVPAIITEPQMRDLGEYYGQSGENGEEEDGEEGEENLSQREKHERFILARDKLIVELLYGSGIRVSELHGLKKRDINWSAEIIRVTGKGNKTRNVPLTTSAVKLLAKYLKRLKGENDGPFVFLRTSNAGRKEYKNYENAGTKRRRLRMEEKTLLTVRRVRQIVNRELARVSQAKKKSPHILRHSFASHLLDNGADIRVVKEMMGHSSLASTQVYTHVSIEKMLKSYKQAHPLATNEKKS